MMRCLLLCCLVQCIKQPNHHMLVLLLWPPVLLPSLCFWWHSGLLTLNPCQLICSWPWPLTSLWKEATVPLCNRIKMKSKMKKEKGNIVRSIGEPTKSKHTSKVLILNTQMGLTDVWLKCFSRPIKNAIRKPILPCEKRTLQKVRNSFVSVHVFLSLFISGWLHRHWSTALDLLSPLCNI